MFRLSVAGLLRGRSKQSCRWKLFVGGSSSSHVKGEVSLLLNELQISGSEQGSFNFVIWCSRCAVVLKKRSIPRRCLESSMANWFIWKERLCAGNSFCCGCNQVNRSAGSSGASGHVKTSTEWKHSQNAPSFLAQSTTSFLVQRTVQDHVSLL